MNKKYNRSFRNFSHIMLILASLICIYPFLLLLMVSLTDEVTLIRNGYSLFPEVFSLQAYRYLYSSLHTLLRAYSITVFITAVGTSVGLIITSMLAYALAQPKLPGGRILSFIVVFSMLFNGGLVSTYLWYVGTIGVKNTIWALLLPSLVTNGFVIMIATNYFRTNVPQEIIEAAYIDGAGKFKVFYSIVVPFSKPILAAIGLMQGIAYWNDWRNGLYYVTDARYFSIQNILNRMLQEIAFLSTSDLGGRAADSAAALPASSVRMAIAVIAVLPVMIIYPFFQKQFARGLTVGAVKG